MASKQQRPQSKKGGAARRSPATGSTSSRAASRRSTSAGRARTGATASPKRKPAPRAAGRPSRPSLAGAMEYARAPYADQPRGRQARKQRRKGEKERQRRLLMIPGAPAVIRGGWPGFLILFFGDGANVLIFGGNGFVLMWLAVVAYAVAGNRAASVSPDSLPRAVRDGALAAALAFAFTVPLQFISGKALQFGGWALGFQIGAAFVIGGLAALIVARARRRLSTSSSEPVDG